MKKVKRMTKAQKIKAMIQAGKTNAEIVKAVPTATLQQIYNHRYLMKKNGVTAAENVRANKLKKAYRKKNPKIAEAWRELSATPEEEEAIQTILYKHANEVQIGGDHYKKKGLQPWDVIIEWKMGFLDGNALKYLARYPDKGGVEDLQKTRHYIDKLIEVETNKEK